MRDGTDVPRLHTATTSGTNRPPGEPAEWGRADVGGELWSEGEPGVLWSLDCAVADIDPATFRLLAGAGLVLVHLNLGGGGGPPPGEAARRAAVRAVRTLRRLGVLVEYDLDLIGAAPRFPAVHSRIRFLRSIVRGGLTPAYFELSSAPISSFSPWLTAFVERLDPALDPWLCDHGLSSRLSAAWRDLTVTERLLSRPPALAAHRTALQRLTKRSNDQLLELVTASAQDFERYGGSDRLDADAIAAGCAALEGAVLELRTAFAGDGLLVRS